MAFSMGVSDAMVERRLLAALVEGSQYLRNIYRQKSPNEVS